MNAVFALTQLEAETTAREFARSYGGVWKGFGRFAATYGYQFQEIVLVNIYRGQNLKQAKQTSEWLNSFVTIRLAPGGVIRHA